MIQDATAVNRQRQLKIGARRAVRAALKAGTLEQLPCEVCGDLKVDAHHLDYSKQLSVRWLCRRHHSSEHTTRYEIMNRAPPINQLHEGVLEGARTTLRTAIQIGELLIAQKKEVGHGNWIPWMDANLRFSPATAGRYMRCFDKRAELNQSPMTDLTLVEVARVVFKPAKQKKDSEQKTPMGDKPGRQKPVDKPDALVERLKKLWGNYDGKVIEPETIAALIDEFAAIAAMATISTIKELWSDVCKEFTRSDGLYPF